MTFGKERTDIAIKELRALADELESGESVLTDCEVTIDSFKMEKNKVRIVRWSGWSASLTWMGERK